MRTEGSEYADLNPLGLNCHLEGREDDNTNMKPDVKAHSCLEKQIQVQRKATTQRTDLHLSGGVIVIDCAVNSSSK